MTTKFFNPTLFRQNDAVGKQAGLYHLLNHGAQWAGLNSDRYGVDLVYRLSHDMDTPPSMLEVEVKRVWPGGQFPYPTVNVLERKMKYFDQGADLLLLSGNLRDYLIIKAEDVIACKPVELYNKYVAQGELFRQVPIEKAEFYRFSRSLRTRNIICKCGGNSFFISETNLICDNCARRFT